MSAEAQNVILWCEQMKTAYDMARKNGINMWGAPLEAWVLKHGRPMGPRIAAEDYGVENMRMKECFGNAFQVTTEDRYTEQNRFTYCEGYAYTPGLLAVHHAWVITEAGEVIDPTWHDGGNECGLCLGEKVVEQEIEDEDAYIEVDCPWCNATGKSDHEHPSREGTEYLGISIPTDKLVQLVIKKGTYGVLPDCIAEIESWTKKEAA